MSTVPKSMYLCRCILDDFWASMKWVSTGILELFLSYRSSFKVRNFTLFLLILKDYFWVCFYNNDSLTFLWSRWYKQGLYEWLNSLNLEKVAIILIYSGFLGSLYSFGIPLSNSYISATVYYMKKIYEWWDKYKRYLWKKCDDHF